GTLAFAPSGYHLMLTKPSRKVAVGDRIPITLEFSDKHKITVQFEVRGPAGK
ncbi:MAG: copper chaperone PCu(A)C, partial [Gemmatimonadaceae bacterium]|nr:copper chaperone PCu(A)C [Gemmatimonadaceae bacterium]